MAPEVPVVHEYIDTAFVIIQPAFPFAPELLCTRDPVLLQLQAQDGDGAAYHLRGLRFVRLAGIRDPPASTRLIAHNYRTYETVTPTSVTLTAK